MAPWHWPSFLASTRMESIVGTVCCLSSCPEIQYQMSGFADCFFKHSSALVSPNGPRHGSPCSIFICTRNTLSLFPFLWPRQHLVRGRLVLGNQRDYPQILERESGESRYSTVHTVHVQVVAIATQCWSLLKVVIKHKGMKRPSIANVFSLPRDEMKFS